jgi:hypothetical protein
MIKVFEMRRALTSTQLAKDTSTEVMKQLIVKNAVRLGQTLSDVELEVITSDLQTYLYGLPISFAEVSLILREGVNGNLSTDKVFKMTSSAVQGWFDSYFKMYVKQRATLVAELQGTNLKKLIAGATDSTAILQESIKRDFEEYKKDNNFLYNRISFKVNAVVYDFLTKTIVSVLRETKNKAWKWAKENAKFFQKSEPDNLIKKIIQAKFSQKTDVDFLINLTKTKLIEVFFASVEKIDFRKQYTI